MSYLALGLESVPAYVDLTAGGLLLQAILGGATGVLVLAGDLSPVLTQAGRHWDFLMEEDSDQ